MAVLPDQLSDEARAFLRERHLATLGSCRPVGPPHVVPVGFTWDGDSGLARVITSSTSRKARLAAPGGLVSICQVDGRRWLSLEGRSSVHDDPERVADAVARYTERYRVPRPNPLRVVIEVEVDRVLGAIALTRAS